MTPQRAESPIPSLIRRLNDLTASTATLHWSPSMKVMRAITIAGILFVCASAAEAELVNGIEAIVDDSVITFYEVSTLNQQTYETAARQNGGETASLEKKLDAIEKENLDIPPGPRIDSP